VILKAYHIARKKNRESIQKNGLIPSAKNSGRIKYSPRIFFSIDSNNLGFDYVDFENVDCWEFEVDSNSIKKDTASFGEQYFYIETAVKPNQLRLFSSH